MKFIILIHIVSLYNIFLRRTGVSSHKLVKKGWVANKTLSARTNSLHTTTHSHVPTHTHACTHTHPHNLTSPPNHHTQNHTHTHTHLCGEQKRIYLWVVVKVVHEARSDGDAGRAVHPEWKQRKVLLSPMVTLHHTRLLQNASYLIGWTLSQRDIGTTNFQREKKFAKSRAQISVLFRLVSTELLEGNFNTCADTKEDTELPKRALLEEKQEKHLGRWHPYLPTKTELATQKGAGETDTLEPHRTGRNRPRAASCWSQRERGLKTKLPTI